MSDQLLASKVVIVEEEPQVRAIPAISTSIAAGLGITERGPVGIPTLVTSLEAFSTTFGGFVPNSDLALAVEGFFDNGGTTLWIVRTVHYADVTQASTKTSAPATLTLNDRAVPPVATLRVFGKSDGAYANALRPVIEAATSGDPKEFNLLVDDAGFIVESFPNVSMDSTLPNYVVTVVNDPSTGSDLIQIEDETSASAAPSNMSAIGTFGPLAGGNDGLIGLADADFVGNAAGKTGLRAFDTVQDLTLLIVPGRATAAVHNAMIVYCEVTRGKSVFAILDPPANQTATGIISYADTTAAILGMSEFAALYWPRIKISNPSAAIFGNVTELVVPPSGHIAGVYSRVDGAKPGGVFTPPAGIENGQLLGAIGFETDEVLDEAKRDLVFPKRINPLTVFPGTPRHIDGARTLKGDGNFPTVAERRGVIFIEQSLKQGTLFAKHQNNTEALRATLKRTVTAFLLIQLKNGAFATTDPKTAFFVDFGDDLNTPSVIFSGQVVGSIGLATAKPAEFVVLRFSQDTRALQAELAGAG